MTSNLLTVIRKNRLTQGIVRKVQYHLSNRAFGLLVPVVPRRSAHGFRRINLVLPTINRAHIFGGIATALQFFRRLSRELGEDVATRIILTEYDPARHDCEGFEGYRTVSWQDDPDFTRQILPFRLRCGATLPVTPGDIFVATQWTTAYMVQRAVQGVADLFSQPPSRLCYLVQDYEPGFYPYSTEQLLSESTYRSSLPQAAVFNSSFLRDYFVDRGYPFEKTYCFEPKLNRILRELLQNQQTSCKRKLILVYGRPSTARNAFPLLSEGLKRWAATYSRAAEWEIVSVGEQHPDIQLGGGIILRSAGKLDLADYARLMREASVGVSLMVSPHPSYPPLEMAHFGLLTVTNGFASKDLSLWHDNIVSLADCTPESLAAQITINTERAAADPSCGLAGKSRTPGYLDDGDAFPFTADLAGYLFP